MSKFTDSQIIEAMKAVVRVSIHRLDWAKITPCKDDQVFCEHNGICTYEMASPLGIETSEARGVLNKLAKHGLICKSKNNRGGQCRWWPVGYLAELKGVS